MRTRVAAPSERRRQNLRETLSRALHRTHSSAARRCTSQNWMQSRRRSREFGARQAEAGTSTKDHACCCCPTYPGVSVRVALWQPGALPWKTPTSCADAVSAWAAPSRTLRYASLSFCSTRLEIQRVSTGVIRPPAARSGCKKVALLPSRIQAEEASLQTRPRLELECSLYSSSSTNSSMPACGCSRL